MGLGRCPVAEAAVGSDCVVVLAPRRKKREVIVSDFDSIKIVDLHGNARKAEVDRDGSPDENVFDIKCGLRRDEAAVGAGLTLSWSSGAVEGHVNRIKLIARQMYGRANFDLLRRRVLLAS